MFQNRKWIIEESNKTSWSLQRNFNWCVRRWVALPGGRRLRRLPHFPIWVARIRNNFDYLHIPICIVVSPWRRRKPDFIECVGRGREGRRWRLSFSLWRRNRNFYRSYFNNNYVSFSIIFPLLLEIEIGFWSPLDSTRRYSIYLSIFKPRPPALPMIPPFQSPVQAALHQRQLVRNFMLHFSNSFIIEFSLYHKVQFDDWIFIRIAFSNQVLCVCKKF